MKIDRTLTANLQELYGLEHAKKGKSHHVVPSLWGNRIYFSEVGWGKILKLIYAVWTFFFGSTTLVRKLKKAIRYTERTFKSQYEALKAHFSNYQLALILLLEEDSEFDPKSYAKERWIFTKWHDSTGPFIDLIKQEKAKKIESVFKRFGRGGNQATSSFRQIPLYQQIKDYQKVIDVVRQIPEKPPLAALKKLSWKRKLFQEEEQQLKKWIDCINSMGDKLKVRTFHKGMQALVKHVETNHRTKHIRNPRVDDLELELAKYGLKIFHQKDAKYIKWCDSLNPSDVLEIRGKKYPLDEELTFCKPDNKFSVHTVKNNPNEVVVVGQNRVILSIKKRGAEEYSWGIRSVNWTEVSQDGRFAIAERLKLPVAKRRWKSGINLHIEDILLLQPIVDQVLWFVKEKATPKNLDSSYIMYDKKNCLTSTKILLKGEFNYPLLVDFCVKCSNKNLTVYKHLIKETQLSLHTFKKYYVEVLKRTLKGTDDSPEDIGALQQFKITDSHVIDKGKEFQKKIIKLQSKCMNKLLDKYAIKNYSNVAKEIGNQIDHEYIKNECICSFWPKAKKRIVAAAVKKLGLSKGSDDDSFYF